MASLRRLFACALTAVFLLCAPVAVAAAQTSLHGDNAAATTSAAPKAYTFWGYFIWTEKTSTWDFMTV
ncbi:MAG: hypothetical protein ABJA81_03300, partial [Nocardioidaceae bacterium]